LFKKVEQIEELKNAVNGIEIGENGKETFRMCELKYCVHLCSQGNPRAERYCENPQEQIDAQKQQIDRLIDIILNS
jgi:hypothetical protein